MPLETAPGCRVGTLCAIDTKPRRFSRRQLADLRALGKLAAKLLTSHRANLLLQQELAEKTQLQQRLTLLASRDALTGLANVTHFREQASAAIATATRPGKSVFLLVDLDHFKDVNDRFGHAFGDKYLRLVAEAMRRSVRDDDIVGRIGGDEFAIVAQGFASEDREVSAIAKRVLREVHAAAAAIGHPDLGKASIGLAIAPLHGTTYERLHACADVAMYAAKKAGRNGFVEFTRELECATGTASKKQEFMAALEKGEIVPYYQLKRDLRTGVPKGLEALARWCHPSRGVLAPGEFAYAFTDTAIGPVLTRHMLRESLRDATIWKSRGQKLGGIAVNVCSADLFDPNFPGDVFAALEATNFNPRMLTLEITESVMMGTVEGIVHENIAVLRARGVQIALDDFGTGYASLVHLRCWPIDQIKIDKTFVQNCLSSAQDQAILKSVIHLSRDLNIQVVAEGIETEPQAAMLRVLGCTVGQGYLFSQAKPLKVIMHMEPEDRSGPNLVPFSAKQEFKSRAQSSS